MTSNGLNGTLRPFTSAPDLPAPGFAIGVRLRTGWIQIGILLAKTH